MEEFYENLFTGPTKKQLLNSRKNKIIELLYMDFLNHYTKEFNHSPDLSICKPVYNQLKNIQF